MSVSQRGASHDPTLPVLFTLHACLAHRSCLPCMLASLCCTTPARTQVAFDGVYVYYVRDGKITFHTRISHSHKSMPAAWNYYGTTRMLAGVFACEEEEQHIEENS